MMVKNSQFLKFLSFALLFCSFFNFYLYADIGQVRGTVIDASTGKPLPGANIILVGTSMGAATDIEGKYFIPRVPPGSYNLKIRYIGFKEKNQTIQVESDRAITIDTALELDVIEGESVTVTAQREGQLAAINQQLTSDAIVNVVSSERILEVPDANVAESVARLPGVSIQRDGGEGSNVVIRGLSPKFNKITIDGIDIASTASTTRSTNLSSISQESLKGIELFKAPTADMDADAIGGTVNLITAKASESPDRLFRLYGAYNALENDYNQYDVFGRLSQRLLSDKLGIQFSVNAEKRNRSADTFSGSYELSRNQAGGVANVLIASASVVDRLEIRKRQGANLIFDYELTNGQLMMTNFFSQTNRDILERRRELNIVNTQGRLRIRETELEIQNLINSLRGEHQIFGLEMDWAVAHSFSKSKRPFDHWIRFIEDIRIPTGLDKNQDAIDYYPHVPVDSSAAIDFAQINIEDVQERNYIVNLNFKYPFHISNSLAGFVKFGGKFKHLSRERTMEEGRLWAYLFSQWNTLKATDFLDNSYKPHNFLDGKADLGLVLNAESNRTFFNENIGSEQYVISPFYSYNGAVTSDSRIPDYKTSENIGAFYIMPRLNYGTVLTLIPGIRYEAIDNTYYGHNYFNLVGNSPKPLRTDYFLNDTTTTQVYHDWLPMIHLKVKPIKWFDIRFSFTRTLSRPNYNFLIPVQSLATIPDSDIYLGRPDLKPARALNYDVYTSVYNSRFGLLTLGYFYKSIDDISVLFRTRVIDVQIQNGVPEFGIPPLKNSQHGIDNLYQSQNLETPINLDESTVKGFELELQTNFKFFPVPNLLKGVVINFNYSRIKSLTYFPFFKVEPEIVLVPYPHIENKYITGLRKGSVPGQANNLINLSLGYDYRGFSARLSMFHQSKSVDEVGTQAELDSYSNDFTRWDLSVRQRFTKNFDLFLNIMNLTETKDNSYFYKKDRSASLEDFGRTVDLGLQVRL